MMSRAESGLAVQRVEIETTFFWGDDFETTPDQDDALRVAYRREIESRVRHAFAGADVDVRVTARGDDRKISVSVEPVRGGPSADGAIEMLAAEEDARERAERIAGEAWGAVCMAPGTTMVSGTDVRALWPASARP